MLVRKGRKKTCPSDFNYIKNDTVTNFSLKELVEKM